MISKTRVQTKQNFDLTNKHYAKEIDTLKIEFETALRFCVPHKI